MDGTFATKSCVKDLPLTIVLNDQGYAELDSGLITGELRGILFRIPEKSRLQGIKVSMILKDYDLIIFSEDIYKDAYYPLKVQSRDGEGQYFTHDNVFYLLNDSLIITAEGAPFTDVELVLRWVEL